MIRRNTCQLLSPVIVLLAAGLASAGEQARDVGVKWLGTGHWQMREDDGDVYLVEHRWSRKEQRLKERHPWSVGAPTIKSEGGLYLSYDLEGKDPSVRLSKEKGDHTRWAFEIETRLSPERVDSCKGPLKEGAKGFTFRISVTEGKYKGWYLAAEEKDGKDRRRGQLLGLAPVFEYVEDHGEKNARSVVRRPCGDNNDPVG